MAISKAIVHAAMSAVSIASLGAHQSDALKLTLKLSMEGNLPLPSGVKSTVTGSRARNLVRQMTPTTSVLPLISRQSSRDRKDTASQRDTAYVHDAAPFTAQDYGGRYFDQDAFIAAGKRYEEKEAAHEVEEERLAAQRELERKTRAPSAAAETNHVKIKKEKLDSGRIYSGVVKDGKVW